MTGSEVGWRESGLGVDWLAGLALNPATSNRENTVSKIFVIFHLVRERFFMRERFCSDSALPSGTHQVHAFREKQSVAMRAP